MELSFIFLFIVLAVLLLLLLLSIYVCLVKRTSRFDKNVFRRPLLYTLITPRRINGANRVAVVNFLSLLIVLSINVVALVLKSDGSVDIAGRAASLLLVNLVLLAIGAKSSFVSDKILGIPLRILQLSHFWSGRISFIHITIHTLLQLQHKGWKAPKDLTLAIIAISVTLVLLPTLYIRRRFYETVVSIHIGLAFALITLLWIHIPLSVKFNWITLSVVTFVIAVRRILWIIFLWFRNRSLWASNNATSDSLSSMTKLEIKLERPFRYAPGQYVYVRFVGIGSWTSRFQAHPFCIAWYQNQQKEVSEKNQKAGDKIDSIHILIEKRRGLSKYICRNGIEPLKVQIDGPFDGFCHDLSRFEKILLISEGVGVSSLLATMKYFLTLEANKFLTRRMDLYWFSQSADQSRMTGSYFQDLIREDSREILLIHYSDPFQLIPELLPGRSRRIRPPGNKQTFFEGEFLKFRHVEAGKTAIIVCGSPAFEAQIQKALWKWPEDGKYRLIYPAFEPTNMISTDKNPQL